MLSCTVTRINPDINVFGVVVRCACHANRGDYSVPPACSTCTGQHPASLSSARWSPGRSSGPERTVATAFPRCHRGLPWVGRKGRDSSCLRPVRCHQPLLCLSSVPPCLLVNFSSSVVLTTAFTCALCCDPLDNYMQLIHLQLIWQMIGNFPSLTLSHSVEPLNFGLWEESREL